MKIAPADLPTILGSTLDEVATRFDDASVPYMLIGGLAVGVHSQARATKDIDFAVLANERVATSLVRGLEKSGFEPRIHGPLGPGAVVRFSRLGDDGVARWVDVLFAGTPFEERALARAIPLKVLGRTLPVVSVEDLLVYKLIAGRPHDVADAVQLLVEHGPRVDRRYLQAAVVEWELSDALARVEALARDM